MLHQKTKTESDKLIDERINVYNNLSVAQLKMNSPDDALHSVEIVLKLQPNNVKALFRKGKVRIFNTFLLPLLFFFIF